MDPIPTARKAYGLVRRESVNEKLQNPEPKECGIRVGLAVFDRNRAHTAQTHQPTRNPSYRKEEDKSKLVCSHCGGKKHTKETCFHIHGFPEWWEEMKKARQARNAGRNNGGRVSAAVASDRATYTRKSAGCSGSTGENQTEEKQAVTSVSVARTWSEGMILPVGIITGGGGGGGKEEEESRVPTGSKETAARVEKKKTLNSHNFQKSQPDPSIFPKPQTDPSSQILSHIIPHNSIKPQSDPHLTPESTIPPHTSVIFRKRPQIAKNLHITPSHQ